MAPDHHHSWQQPPSHLPAAASSTCRGLRGPEQSLPRVQHDALWLDKSAAAARPQNCPALPLEVVEDIPLHKDKPTTEEEAGQCTQALSKQASVLHGLCCTPYLLCLQMPQCCRALAVGICWPVAQAGGCHAARCSEKAGLHICNSIAGLLGTRWLHMSVPVPASCHTLLWCCLETLKVFLFAGPAAHWCWAACGGLWQGQRLQQQQCLSSGQQPPAQQHPCGAGCGRSAGAERQRSVEPGVYLHLGGKPQCFNLIRLEMKPLSCSWTV